jgi:hypothetical protein
MSQGYEAAAAPQASGTGADHSKLRRMASQTVRPLKYGSGGLVEMKSYLDDSTVMYGLVAVPFGTGSFARNKNIFVHFIGPSCPTVKKGRLNAKMPTTKTQLSPYHGEITIYASEELTEEHFHEQLQSKFADESNMSDLTRFSIQHKVEYHEEVVESIAAEVSPTKELVTAQEMRILPSAQTCLKQVQEDKGLFNWVLLKADAESLTLHNAGCGSVEEMDQWLADDEVLYGLIRMGFGAGRFRRTYWVHAHWTSDNVPAVKKGKQNACAGAMKDLCKPFACEIEATDADEITLEAVIDKLKRSVVSDGTAEGKEQPDEDKTFSLAAFQEALAEERAEILKLEETQDVEETEHDENISVEELLRKVTSPEDAVNWALFDF